MGVEFCEEISTVIYLKVVGISNVPEITAGFERKGFLNCFGSISGTHVPIV